MKSASCGFIHYIQCVKTLPFYSSQYVHINNSKKGSGLFDYLGHARFEYLNALDSAFELQGSKVTLTVRDIMQKVKLTFPALCTLTGCASGVAKTTSADDIISLPTAFHFAGASSVVSTLWPVEKDDGAAFSLYFYKELCRVAAKTDAGGFIDVAKVFQTAVCQLHNSFKDSERTPYRWAGFFLQGLWLLPVKVVR